MYLSRFFLPCIRVLHLEDIIYTVIENNYYYSRMTKQCIEKQISDIYYKKLIPDINSTANIWNMSDDEIDEEDFLSNNYTDYS